MSEAIRPYRIEVADTALDDLRARAVPDPLPGSGNRR